MCFTCVLVPGALRDTDPSLLSEKLLPVESLAASAAFWIIIFAAVLSTSIVDFLAWSGSFLLYLLLKFSLKFSPIFFAIYLEKIKK